MDNKLVLASGKEVEIDLNKITIVEFRLLADEKTPEEKQYEILDKLCGLETKSLGYLDFKKLIEFVAVLSQKTTNPT